MSNDDFHFSLMRLVDLHIPLKIKYLRGNDQPFMNKQLRKEHMKRTMLKNKFLKNRTSLNWKNFKIQRNYCVKLLRDTKKHILKTLNLQILVIQKNSGKQQNHSF